jgi:hypothetical protein
MITLAIVVLVLVAVGVAVGMGATPDTRDREYGLGPFFSPRHDAKAPRRES